MAAKSRSATGQRLINMTHARLLEDFRQMTFFSKQDSGTSLLEPDVNIFPERPSTPILENVIMSPPKDLEELQTLIKRRTQPSLERSSLSNEQQRELSFVLHAQVNNVWQELSELADDSRLTQEENIELRVRMTAYVITTCQELFKYYLHQYETMRKREFCTDHANFTRLKVQLASDSRKLMNVLTIRRYIASDILRPTETVRKAPSPAGKRLTYKKLLAASQPKVKAKEGPLTFEQQIERLKHDIPDLHAERLREATMALRQIAEKLQYTVTPVAVEASSVPEERVLHALGRSSSLPDLHRHESLFDEYDISKEDCELPYKECDEKALKFQHVLKSEKLSLQKLKQAKDAKSELRRDLQMLIEHDRFAEDDDGAAADNAGNTLLEIGLQDDSRMPPLISVIMSEYKQLAKARKAKLEELERQKQLNVRKLVELNEERDALLDSPPTHISYDQPFVHTTQLSTLNATKWKVACGRVSERQCKSFLHLDAHSTLWNELEGELDEEAIEHLDRNLYAGREIREVYAGIMSTVKTDHLEASLDEAIEECPVELSTQGLFASASYNLEIERRSSTISLTPDEGKDKDAVSELLDEDGHFNHSAFLQGRIMNESLIPAGSRAPWYEMGLQEWAKLSFIPKEKKISSVEEMERSSPIYSRLLEILNDKFRKLAHLDSSASNSFTMSLPQVAPANNAGKPAETTMASQFEDSVPKSAVLLSLDELRTTLASTARNVQDKMLKQYKTLVNRWMDVIDSDDYLKFLLTQDTDYLGLVFHLYEEQEASRAPGSVSEERSRAGTVLSLQLAARRKEIEQRLDELRKAKTQFTPGQWNVNSVLMGGLGRDPSVQHALPTEAEPEAASATQSPLEATSDSSLPSKSTSRAADLQNDLIQYGEAQQRKLATLQDRLEHIWKQVGMPDKQRLDMAIKYSSDRYAPLLERAVRRWEKTVSAILHREAVLAELEQFERQASDPRFYTLKSGFLLRKENKRRAQLEQQLAEIEPDIRRRLSQLEREFQDSVTFKGRVYLEKMQRDKIEMLFWLGEERKELVLKRQQMVQQLQAQVNATAVNESFAKDKQHLGASSTFDASALIRVMPAYSGVKLQPI